MSFQNLPFPCPCILDYQKCHDCKEEGKNARLCRDSQIHLFTKFGTPGDRRQGGWVGNPRRNVPSPSSLIYSKVTIKRKHLFQQISVSFVIRSVSDARFEKCDKLFRVFHLPTHFQNYQLARISDQLIVRVFNNRASDSQTGRTNKIKKGTQ